MTGIQETIPRTYLIETIKDPDLWEILDTIGKA